MDELQQQSDEDLWSALSEATGRDRVDVLIELGSRAGHRGEFDRAMTLWQQLESTARELADDGLLAEALEMQGRSAFFACDYESAIDLYQRSAQGFGDLGKSREAAGVLWCLADSYAAHGDLDNQLQAAEQSRRIAEVEEEPILAGQACLLQARALYFLNREQEALAACVAGREHFRQSGRPERVAEIDDFAISVHIFLGNLDEALDLARGCLVLAQMTSAESDDDQARVRLAEVLRLRGDLDAALEQADLALQSFRSRDEFLGAARCERLRAEVFFDSGDLDKCLEALSDARVLFDAIGYDMDALRCEDRIAIARHSLGDYRKAARDNERLIHKYLDLEDQHGGARWSVVRLLDNLVQGQMFQECLEAADKYEELWPETDVGADSGYREFLGLYALALDHVGRTDEATEIAERVIAGTPAREANIATAYCYEVRGRSRLEQDEAGASQDLSHAIALHLVRGQTARARELSEYFLPVDSERGDGFDGGPVRG